MAGWHPRYQKSRSFSPKQSTYPGQRFRENEDSHFTKVNKDPYYRTMDILNGIFKKKIRLEDSPGGNCTDLKTIWVNFGETRFRPIVGFVKDGKSPAHSVYMLECGHEWEGKAGHPTDGSKPGACWTCGSNQSYLGFEHEWQHIIFKTDLNARALFAESYANQLSGMTQGILTKDELKGFLSIVINAFDDIRCNSLWEKVYPGSAADIWKRWKRLTEERGDNVSKDFLSFIFAVAFGVPTDPNGKLEPLRPVIEWGIQKVKYRGFPNMLIDVRVVLDRCMGALLADIPPQPPKQQPPEPQQPQPQPGQQSNDQQGQSEPGGESTEGENDNGEGEEDEQDQQEAGGQEGDQEEDSEGAEGQGGDGEEAGQEDDPSGSGSFGSGVVGEDEEVEPPSHIPSAQSLPSSPSEKADALATLMIGAMPLDKEEEHPDPDKPDFGQAASAVLAKVLGADLSDLDQLDKELGDDEPDQEMQQALDQLQSGLTSKSSDSQLTSNAKAHITIIDVTPHGVVKDQRVELTSEERFEVTRMRSSFFRSLGRQKAKRNMAGVTIDVSAMIQYRIDRQDPDVFETDSVQRGFAYSILCDMSGSMVGLFPQVCHAVEMLKASLDFPFVVGNLWGFRGGEDVSAKRAGRAEVWLYRYDKKCEGYTGDAKAYSDFLGRYYHVPVRCGGLTPMHSALNVAVTHLWRKVPVGMAKRLFLLTDGSPCSNTVSGGSISQGALRNFVKREITTARKHGIQVYTLVLGHDAIKDEDCMHMFGVRQFWKKVGLGDGDVDKALSTLVRDNFTKYLKMRG